MSDKTTSQRKRPPGGESGEDTMGNKKRAAVGSTPGNTNESTNASTTPDVMDNEWRIKLDISPPQKEVASGDDDTRQTTMKVDASLCDVEKMMRDDGLDNYVLKSGAKATDENIIVYYLYGVEFCKDKDATTRVKEVMSFLAGENVKKRMMDFLKKDSDMSQCIQNLEAWRQVQGVILCYQEMEGSKTIFDDRNMPVSMRTQATKNCYQHATGGTVGYKIAFDKGNNDHMVHTVDVPKFMRRYYDERKLKKRVLENKGGKSQGLMKSMVDGTGLKLGSTLDPDDVQDRPHTVIEMVSEKGPALISRFRTDHLFKSQKTGYSSPGGSYRIHQFDRVNNKDTHDFFDLGRLTHEAKSILTAMETRNKKLQEEGNSSLIVPGVSLSSDSHESHESGTTVESEAVFEGAAGLHAMILIGYRKEASGKTWYLVQNTWKFMPVFEASPTFLAHRLKHDSGNGSLVFLTGKFQGGSNKLEQINCGLCLESTCDDDMAEGDDIDDEEDDNSIDLEE